MNIQQLMKQAQQMNKKLKKIRTEYEAKEFDFSSANGEITGKINGKLAITELNIKEELLGVENKEDLQDLLTITINDIVGKVSKEKQDLIDSVTGGIGF